ncbi:MAG: FeoA family protein [Chloroherpetonaceae bacterium]|nr:ferrous iron transport protein A [Chthonomonadaceae bacterium]MDW8208326.1 FeoA family protein [Chloroherpetonaceae bacterium]
MFRKANRQMFAQAAQAALDAQQNREDEAPSNSRKNLQRNTSYRRGVTLDQLRPGECGTVRRLLGSTQGRLRLLEMGMTIGTHVRVLRTAAFGGPIDVLLRGYQLSLRRDEAACIYLDDEIDAP